MEINGKTTSCLYDPALASFDENETITVTPLRAFPVIKDLVTDVSFNYEEARWRSHAYDTAERSSAG
jgi:succinate dehydrogenase / fumarate reductase iron-sulfur subunit